MSEIPKSPAVQRFLKHANWMLKSIIVQGIFLGLSIALLIAEITVGNTHVLGLPNWVYLITMLVVSTLWFIYLLKKMEQDLPEYAAWHKHQNNTD